MAKTSVYLNKERTADIEALGLSLLEVIDLGLKTEPCAVYLLHDADGDLLYVGIAKDPAARWRQHAADKPWWPEVAERKVEWFSSRKNAEAAERAAIAAQSPRYNISRGVGRPGRRRSVYLSDETDAALTASGLSLPEVIRRGLQALAFEKMLADPAEQFDARGEVAAKLLASIREYGAAPPAAAVIPPGSLAVGDAIRLRHEGTWPADPATATLRTDREPCPHPKARRQKNGTYCGACGRHVSDVS